MAIAVDINGKVGELLGYYTLKYIFDGFRKKFPDLLFDEQSLLLTIKANNRIKTAFVKLFLQWVLEREMVMSIADDENSSTTETATPEQDHPPAPAHQEEPQQKHHQQQEQEPDSSCSSSADAARPPGEQEEEEHETKPLNTWDKYITILQSREERHTIIWAWDSISQNQEKCSYLCLSLHRR